MKYSFTCKADGKLMTVTANSDAAAIKKLIVLGKKHVKQAHSTASPMTDKEWEKFIRSGWKKQD